MLGKQVLWVNGVRLAVATGPNNGPPLLLLHGVLRAGRDFAPLWPALLPCWQVLAVDQRGHGGSERCPGRYRVCDYAADALALFRALEAPGQRVLYGHSLGALVAVAVAAAEPQRTAAVVLEDPPAPSFLADVRHSAWHAIWTQMRALAGSAAPTRDVARALAEVRVPASGWREVRLGDVRDATSLRFSARCLRDVDPDVFAPLLEDRWLEGFDLAAALAGVQCPALILRGDEALGGMLGRAEAEQLAGLMADGTVVDVPGAGHLIHWQASEATARLVLGFLESL